MVRFLGCNIQRELNWLQKLPHFWVANALMTAYSSYILMLNEANIVNKDSVALLNCTSPSLIKIHKPLCKTITIQLEVK